MKMDIDDRIQEALASYYMSFSVLGALNLGTPANIKEDGLWPLRTKFIKLYFRQAYNLHILPSMIRSRLRHMNRYRKQGVHKMDIHSCLSTSNILENTAFRALNENLSRDILARSVLRASVDVSVSKNGLLLGEPMTLQTENDFLDRHFSLYVQGPHISGACFAVRTNWKISHKATIKEISPAQTLEQRLPFLLDNSSYPDTRGKGFLPPFVEERLFKDDCGVLIVSLVITLKNHSSALNKMMSVVLTDCEPTTHVEVVMKFTLVRETSDFQLNTGCDRNHGGIEDQRSTNGPEPPDGLQDNSAKGMLSRVSSTMPGPVVHRWTLGPSSDILEPTVTPPHEPHCSTPPYYTYYRSDLVVPQLPLVPSYGSTAMDQTMDPAFPILEGSNPTAVKHAGIGHDFVLSSEVSAWLYLGLFPAHRPASPSHLVIADSRVDDSNLDLSGSVQPSLFYGTNLLPFDHGFASDFPFFYSDPSVTVSNTQQDG